MRIYLSRFPWQMKAEHWERGVKTVETYGWRSGYLGRFGGGWRWKFGIAIGGNTILLDVLIGSVRIDFSRKAQP